MCRDEGMQRCRVRGGGDGDEVWVRAGFGRSRRLSGGVGCDRVGVRNRGGDASFSAGQDFQVVGRRPSGGQIHSGQTCGDGQGAGPETRHGTTAADHDRAIGIRCGLRRWRLDRYRRRVGCSAGRCRHQRTHSMGGSVDETGWPVFQGQATLTVTGHHIAYQSGLGRRAQMSLRKNDENPGERKKKAAITGGVGND